MEVGAINQPGQERTFLMSTTHGAEMVSLAAFLEAAAIYEECQVVDHLWQYGAKLMLGLETLAREAGVAHAFHMHGNAISHELCDNNSRRGIQFAITYSVFSRNDSQWRHDALDCT